MQLVGRRQEGRRDSQVMDTLGMVRFGVYQKSQVMVGMVTQGVS